MDSLTELKTVSEKEAVRILNAAETIKCYYLKLFSVSHRRKYGQYFTSSQIAGFMATLLNPIEEESVKILDPGAGTGILGAAVVEQLVLNGKTKKIELIAIELDKELNTQLHQTYKVCAENCAVEGIDFSYRIINEDFIELGYKEIAENKEDSFFAKNERALGFFDVIVMNPPYKKILNNSGTRKVLNILGEESTNLYTAFLSLAKYFLCSSGQMLAITPRSFCSGTYFKKFRTKLFKELFFHKIHLYNDRNKAFNEDGILQENIIFVLSPSVPPNQQVQITTSDAPDDGCFKAYRVDHNHLVNLNDENKIVHIITDEYSERVLERMSLIKRKLNDLGLSVSTGKVVDFRAKDFLANPGDENISPLFYPMHFVNNKIVWPQRASKKKQAIVVNENTKELLIKSGYYTFCKRFSSKEEKKRIVAAVFEPDAIPVPLIGVENHVNYFHSDNKPMLRNTAVGLAVYLNSTIVDQYFRLFNGHTQVNADDLRYLPFPDLDELNRLGNSVKDNFPSQEEIDLIIDKELFNMSKEKNPVNINQKIHETIEILRSLEVPKDQQNERSALTLLAILNLQPQNTWAESSSVLIGITSIMDFIKKYYKKEYAPNTRESIRRQTVHQFVQAGIVIPNPDKPRPTNSPNFVYEIEPATLELIKTYKSKNWEKNLKKYLVDHKTLSAIYEQKRKMQRIPIRLSERVEIYLSSGEHNELVEKIINDFCPYFIRKGKVIYIGDTKSKWAFFDEKYLAKLGAAISDYHGKMPDVIIHDKEKDWLVLIEAVTSHGPINPKRKIELEKLFKRSKAGLVLVTTFLNKKTMMKYLNELAWETDIWIADNPTHLIHLNGKRFLGPYT